MESTINIDDEVWSVLEDRVLLKAEEMKADAVALYSQKQKETPNQYPKALTDNAVRARLLELRSVSNARRLKLLRAMQDEAPSPKQAAGAPVGIALNRLRNIAGTHASTDGQASQSTKEDTILRCVSRGQDTEEVLSSSKIVAKQSPFISDLLAIRESNFADEMKVVELSENADMWLTFREMHRVFGVDNVTRFVQFTRDPQMLENKVRLEDELTIARAKQKEEWDTFVSSISKSREVHLESLKTKNVAQVEKLRAELDEALEEDLQAIRSIYRTHAEVEIRKLQESQRLELEATSKFFDDELNRLEELSAQVEPSEVTDLAQEVQRISYAVEQVFPKESLPRLLMLADVLRCSDLKTACCKEIARQVQTFATNPEMRSDLIRASTFRELLSFMPDEQLMKLKKLAHRCCLPKDILEEEWGQREASARAEAESLSVDDIFKKWKSLPHDHIWSAVFGEVYDERVKAQRAATNVVSRGLLFPKTCQRYIDTTHGTFELTAPFHYVTGEIRLSLRIGEGVRRGYFEFRAQTIPKGSTVIVGFDVCHKSSSAAAKELAAENTFSATSAGSLSPTLRSWAGDKEHVLGNTASLNGNYGCGLSNDGVLHVNGSVEDARTGFHTGDVIGVGIDQLSGGITFFKNGCALGLPRNVVASVAIKEDVVPCVTLYQSACGDAGRLKFSVEAEHDFAFSVPSGFKPYAMVSQPMQIE